MANDLRFQLAANGMVNVPEGDLPSNWDSMKPKEQNRWLAQYARKNGGNMGDNRAERFVK